MDEDLILRAWNWYLDLLKKDDKLVMGTYVLMEVMQKVGQCTPTDHRSAYSPRPFINLWDTPVWSLPGHIQGTSIISNWARESSRDRLIVMLWHTRRWPRAHMRFVLGTLERTTFQILLKALSIQKRYDKIAEDTAQLTETGLWSQLGQAGSAQEEI